MEPNLAGSIYERSSIKLLHLVQPIRKKELILVAMCVGRMEPNEEA
jgi:hypothetical protein